MSRLPAALLAGLLLGACGGGDTGSDSPAPSHDRPAAEGFCARVERAGHTERFRVMRAEVRALARRRAPDSMSRHATAGLRELAVTLSSSTRAQAKAQLRAMDGVRLQRVTAFRRYAERTCGVDPLGGLVPRDPPTPAATVPPSPLPTPVPDDLPPGLPTGLPTDVFPQLTELPEPDRPPERPSGIPSELLSAWESMYPTAG